MTETKHTPWTITRKSTFSDFRIQSGDTDIAIVFSPRIKYVGGNRADLETGEANARLIAAAPELLEALKDLAANAQSMWRHDLGRTDDHPLVDKAFAAIAKAEGRDA